MTDINKEDQALALEFFTACAKFLRGSWSAKRGGVTRNAKGVERPLFDIIIPQGQLAGVPVIGRIVLVTKAKGEVAPFVLIEQLTSPHTTTAEGVAITTWTGTPVKV